MASPNRCRGLAAPIPQHADMHAAQRDERSPMQQDGTTRLLREHLGPNRATVSSNDWSLNCIKAWLASLLEGAMTSVIIPVSTGSDAHLACVHTSRRRWSADRDRPKWPREGAPIYPHRCPRSRLRSDGWKGRLLMRMPRPMMTPHRATMRVVLAFDHREYPAHRRVRRFVRVSRSHQPRQRAKGGHPKNNNHRKFVPSTVQSSRREGGSANRSAAAMKGTYESQQMFLGRNHKPVGRIGRLQTFRIWTWHPHRGRHPDLG